MGFKSGILFITLLVGTLAVPSVIPDVTPNENLFYHTDPSARIVGGTEVALGGAPHMVALTSGILIRSFLCGGSLLTTRTVLTAAHCIAAVFSWGSLTSSLRGTVGTNRWNSGGTSYAFARNVTHQHYLSSTIKNDIGILVTSNLVSLSATVNVVPLSFVFTPGGVDAKVTGWGRIRQGGALSATLLELTMKTLDGDECARAVTQNPVEPHIELCTIHEPGFGTCNGDSGSALLDAASGQQIGIVSWGIPCATAAPDMFVRVSAYSDWLLQHVVS